MSRNDAMEMTGQVPSATSSNLSLSSPMKECPEPSRWWIDQWFYGWATTFVWRGYKHPIQAQDLYLLSNDIQSKTLADEFERLWTRSQQDIKNSDDPKREVTVFNTLKQQFGRGYASIGIFHLIQAAANICSPVLVSNITQFVQTAAQSGNPGAPPAPPVSVGIGYALGFFGLQLVAAISLNRYFYHAARYGLKIRTCLTIAAYRKAMRLSSLSRQKFSGGRILNMISSDLTRMEMSVLQGHYIWSGPAQIISILALLIYYISYSALAGFALLVLMLPFQAVMFTRLGKLRQIVAGISDTRIRSTQEFLQGMRIIKLFAWENSFLDRLLKLRTAELRQIRSVNIWTGILFGIATSVPILASVISFIVFAFTSNTLNPPLIFAALSLFNLMRFPLMILPNVIRSFVETRVGLKRLGDFLNATELEEVAAMITGSSNAIEIKNADFQWEVLPDEINDAKPLSKPVKPIVAAKAEMKDEELKGSLEELIAPTLDSKQESRTELIPAPGNNEASKIGAAYHVEIPVPKILKADVIHLRDMCVSIPKGKLVAIVGSVGSGKSSLLSAILSEMRKLKGELYVDGSIGYSLQQPWIQNGTLRSNITFGKPYNRKKYDDAVSATALTKDLEWLPGGSDTLLGEKGVQISGGQKARVSLARIVYGEPDIVLLDDPISAVDVHVRVSILFSDIQVGRHLFKECIKKALKGKTVLLVTHHLNYVREVDYILYMKDGKIHEQGTYAELMALNGECARVVKAFAGDEEENTVARGTVDDKKETQVAKQSAKPATEEERVIGSVSWSVYNNYLQAAGGAPMMLSVVFFAIFTQVARVGNDLWLVAWSSSYFSLNMGSYAGIYFAWGTSQGLSVGLLGATLAFAFARASTKFHRAAINGVFASPIGFFDTTPLGRMMNRFSKDTDTMDSTLPSSLQMFINVFMGLLSTLILMCYSTPLLMAPLLPLLLIYYFFQTLYVRTSREVKRLESISRSPIFAHFGETMTGLSTIRAYRRQIEFVKTCEDYVNVNNQAVYMQLITQRWLGIRLEMLGAMICFFAALFAVLSNGAISPALVGISLSYALQVTSSLNFTVRQAVEVEVNANSIERLNYYATSLERERELVNEKNRPPKDWPSQGEIQIKDLEIKYSHDGPAVIKQITLDINSREKIGVVGRTGAGKSTITLALFRLLEPSGGQVIIDGVNICEIGLHDLRSRLAIIPQDPILFSGTVRTNLDPFSEHTDQKMWDVLASVNMKEAIRNTNDGLDAKVDLNGENFSTGQRQLLCLARAMLRSPKIIVMDEATANVDMESDQLIQKSLRNDFKDSTIITIAHRLNTVIDYSRILVLDQGKLVEYASPHELLQKGGIFAEMVDNTGDINSAMLRRLAKGASEGQSVSVESLLALDSPPAE